MIELSEIQAILSDRNLREVSRQTGIYYGTLYRLAHGVGDPSFGTVYRLTQYLEKTGAALNSKK